jgi:serine/threonine protein kinase
MIASPKWFIKLPDYKQGDLLGHGTYGRVYQAVRLRDQLPVAIKHIRPFDSFDSSLSFIREIQIPAESQHPAILPLIGFKFPPPDNSEGPVIVTKLCSNGSLEDILREVHSSNHPPGFSWIHINIALYGVAQALAFLHQRQYVHRDLKPGNILFDEKWRPYLADFGLARKVITDEETADLEGMQMTTGIGTRLLMSPELFDIRTEKYAGEVDVYAFAVTMYLVFATERPILFEDGTEVERGGHFGRKLQQGLRFKRPEKCPDCWWNLITQGWCHTPGNRPSAQQIAQMLERPEFVLDLDRIGEYQNYIQELKTFTG